MQRQIKLSPSDMESLQKLDQSIEHWSIQATKALIQVDDMKGHARAAYVARQRIVDSLYKEAGVDPLKITHAELKPDGTLDLVLEDAPSDPEASGIPSPA
jgi:hypothetical protein